MTKEIWEYCHRGDLSGGVLSGWVTELSKREIARLDAVIDD